MVVAGHDVYDMAKLLLTLGWLFIASAICVVAYPFFAPVVTFDPLINGLPAGILVALGAQLLSQCKYMRDASEKRASQLNRYTLFPSVILNYMTLVH